MPYHMSSFSHLTSKGYDLFVVNKDKNTLSSYRPQSSDHIKILPRSEFNQDSLYGLIDNLNPLLIACAGTLDKDYLSVLKKYRKNHNIPVIMFSDTQWRGGLQWLNVLTSKWRHKKWFSHVLVAGTWQYEYARRLGFRKNKILYPYLSADDKLFKSIDIEEKKKQWPKKLLYCGRFAEVKGLDLLLHAWQNIPDHKGWTLTLIGEGPIKIKSESNIEVVGYKTQVEILDYMNQAGAFVLPSRFEPWALVIHEAALAGLPIICSDCIGASTAFCINKSNAFIFKTENASDLEKVLIKLINMNDSQLYEMAQRSRNLGERITSRDVADAIESVIY